MMKINHRTPAASWFATPESDPVGDDYETEVQQTTERGERQQRQAQERLARTEQRLAQARRVKSPGHKKRIAQLQALINERRAELAEIEGTMQQPPVVITDKRIKFRTGRDDHLELGEPQ